jgi:hypothetical protein
MVLSNRFCRATSISQWAMALSCALLVGCKREEIRVYTAPKDLPPPSREHAAHSQGQGVRPHAHYKVPEGWNELPAEGIRAARFAVPTKSGHDLDVSVISLPGVAAGKLDIVNLWREQVQLPPVAEADLAAMTEVVRVGEIQGDLFEMVSAEALINEKQKARILVAMVKDSATSWFMKMTGEDDAVREQKPKFIEFLNSLTFDYGSHGAETQTASAPPQNTNSGGKPAWQVPANWKEVPPTEMLLAKFVVPGKGDDKAEVTVSVFPGDVGGLHLNINRWRRQIGLPEADEKTTKELARPLETVSQGAVLVDMSGAAVRVIGAIVPDGGRTWFYKLTGSPNVAEAEKDSLVKFVQSAKQAKQNGG